MRACVVVLALGGAAPAHAQNHVDVLFYEVEGALATGATDFGPPFDLIPDVRVFPVRLDVVTGGGVSLSPGFTADASPPEGEALPANTPIGFAVEPVALLGDRFLSWWSGTGDVAFEAPATTERIEIDPTGCFSCTSVFVTETTAGAPAWPLGTTSASGSLHQHHDFKLGTGPGGSGAANGVYLLALRAEIAGLEPSPPFFVLFGKSASNGQLGSAASWVEANLLVPEPDASAAALSALLAVWALRRHRRVIASSIVTS